jgi:hypothetical protein
MLEQYSAKLWLRFTLLTLAFIVMIFLSSTNVVKIKNEYKPGLSSNTQSQQKVGADPTRELIKEEHEKAMDEIKASLEQMDTWYHYKFILIGGVIAVFLGNIGILGKRDSVSYKASERILESALMSNRTGAMLALICLVALVIDMHIRSNVNGIQQLGQWLSNYVEPSYLSAGGITTGNYPNNALAEIGFIPWETFIRLPRTGSSTFYAVAYSIQLHFMTMVSYVLYMMVFQNISLQSKKGKRQQIAVIGFLFVHISLLAFIVVAHTVRDIFNVGCFPMISLDVCSLSGSHGSAYYFIAWLCLIAFNLPYLFLPIIPKAPHRQPSSETVPDTAT